MVNSNKIKYNICLWYGLNEDAIHHQHKFVLVALLEETTRFDKKTPVNAKYISETNYIILSIYCNKVYISYIHMVYLKNVTLHILFKHN